MICELARLTPHLAISQDSQAAQDAVDAELVARYRPGQNREGLLVELVERLTEISEHHAARRRSRAA